MRDGGRFAARPGDGRNGDTMKGVGQDTRNRVQGPNELCPLHPPKCGYMGHKELCLCPVNTPVEKGGAGSGVPDSKIGVCSETMCMTLKQPNPVTGGI